MESFVDHIESLSDDLGLLFNSGEFSDVTFLVDGEDVLGHRMLLASRSKYYRAMLFGGLAESQQTKIELDVKLKPFKLILTYIYTGYLELDHLDDEDFMDLLGLVHEYEMEKLQSAVVQILQGKLSLETCYWLYNAAVKYDLDKLLKHCQIFLDKEAATFVKHPSFNMLTEPALKLLLQRNSFYSDEIDIFMAAKAWCEQFPKIDPKSILADVQYSLISIQDLVQKVKPTGLVEAEVLLKAIEGKFDGSSKPKAHPQCTFKDLQCKNIEFSNYGGNMQIIDCRNKCIICCITFGPSHHTNIGVESSLDQSNWTYLSNDIAERSKRKIRFKKAIPVRFLRIYSRDNVVDEITGISFV